jgi:hypothetical protein
MITAAAIETQVRNDISYSSLGLLASSHDTESMLIVPIAEHTRPGHSRFPFVSGSPSALARRRSLRGRWSRRSGSGGNWGLASLLVALAGMSSTFLSFLRSITSPARPAITSNMPAMINQCGSPIESIAKRGSCFSAFLRCQRAIILSGIDVLADTRAPSCEIVININDDLPKPR